MKIGDFEVTSPGDVAVVLLAVPAGYFGWISLGNPAAIDPQIVGPLFGSVALGVKKAIEASALWERHRKAVVLSKVRKLQRDLRGPSYAALRDALDVLPRRDATEEEVTAYVLALGEIVDRWAREVGDPGLEEVGRAVLHQFRDYMDLPDPSSRDSHYRLLICLAELRHILHTTPHEATEALAALDKWSGAATSAQIESEYARFVQALIGGARPTVIGDLTPDLGHAESSRTLGKRESRDGKEELQR